MSLRDELACVLPEDDRPALPRYEGPPLDEMPRAPVAVLSGADRRVLSCVPRRRWWTTEQIARAYGRTTAWTAGILRALEDDGAVERSRTRPNGRGKGFDQWRRR